MARASIGYEGRSFERFLSWTDEKEILGKEILKLVRPSFRSLLEIGAGNGDLTEHYIGFFERVLLLEPSRQYYKRLQERFPSATVLNIRAEDFGNGGSSYDMIVASHVLVYVTQPLDLIDKLYSTLREGGRFVIIMVEPDCCYLRFVGAFYEKVTGTKADTMAILWSDIVPHLAAQRISFRVTDLSSSIHAPSIDGFLGVGDLLFNIDASQIQDTIADQMRLHLKDYLTDDGLRIDVGHKVIVVEK